MTEKTLTILIPAYNEGEIIEKTIKVFNNYLKKENISHNILVINDHSNDNTEQILINLKKQIPELSYINNDYQSGFGSAVIKGLRNFTGDYIAIVMADLSDHPQDIKNFYHEMNKGYDCVFGSRFIKGGRTIDYPPHKLLLNRLGNIFIRILFRMKYNDTTNACKMYRKETIQGLEPFLSKHFNLTVELPLKAIVRGYSYSILPNIWKNRTTGIAKFKVKEMGSRYFFIIFYCLFEKWLSQGDYKKGNGY
jgi:dolichol-phosphate mannosyltransferase